MAYSGIRCIVNVLLEMELCLFWQVCKLLGNSANLIQSDLVALLKDESIEVGITAALHQLACCT